MKLRASRITPLLDAATPVARSPGRRARLARDRVRSATHAAARSPAAAADKRRFAWPLPALYLAAALLVLAWIAADAARWLWGAATGDWRRWSASW